MTLKAFFKICLLALLTVARKDDVKKETIEKQKKTNLEKYGVESVLQNKKIIEKKKQTTIERHGIESCFQDPIIQEKINLK